MGWIELIIAIAPKVIELGMKAAPVVEGLISSIRSNEEPTPADWEALDKLETMAREVLHKPFADE
jgi:hypothetical protein